MTSPRANPGRGKFLGYDHIHFWVGNALQAADFYVCRFGFTPVAFRGLETGSRKVMTRVVRADEATFVFSSPIEPGNVDMTQHAMRHGDSVKDVAFRVDDCQGIFDRALAAGATPVSLPETLRDRSGVCKVATIAAPFADLWHTLVERENYAGTFLPGYRDIATVDPYVSNFESTLLSFVDHCVINQPNGRMDPVVDWYVQTLGFHRFWSVDDRQVHTKYSSLRSVVVADYDERVKMPINEPAAGLRKSQIQEFIDYNAGPGIQHIALNSRNIISTISRLQTRGVQFIQVPDAYYDDLRRRLGDSHSLIQCHLKELKELGILVDFDSNGYLLQLFTKPIQDRPTLFLEIIERNSHSGFGVGNFKSLFEAIEREQALRGNL